MLTNCKTVLAGALVVSAASQTLAGHAALGRGNAANTVHLRSVHHHADGKSGYAFSPLPRRNSAVVAAPRPGCNNVYNYDRALDGYSYDLVCNGIDLSPH